MNTAIVEPQNLSGRALLPEQRSHLLLVLSQPAPGGETVFRDWYVGPYRRTIDATGVLKAQHFEQHEVDITRGKFSRPPCQYLGVYELSLDGAHQAENLIDRITTQHREQPAAQVPATWLYYPVSEKVGGYSGVPSMLVVAFANGAPGREDEFREWYVTGHIRHALKIPSLVAGQCFERTQFQRSGALEAAYSMIALYEHVGTAQDFIDGHSSLPKGSLPFPSLDLNPSRFAECLYRPV